VTKKFKAGASKVRWFFNNKYIAKCNKNSTLSHHQQLTNIENRLLGVWPCEVQKDVSV